MALDNWMVTRPSRLKIVLIPYTPPLNFQMGQVAEFLDIPLQANEHQMDNELKRFIEAHSSRIQ